MTTTDSAKWTLGVVAAIAGVGLAVIGLLELMSNVPASSGQATEYVPPAGYNLVTRARP